MISNLPANVKDTILTYLTLREAVRTSILSKKWRYSWTSLPELVFDDTMFEVPRNNINQLLLRYKLISTIYQVLLLHQGSILEFVLNHTLLESCPEIDHLMVFLSKSGVEEFELMFQAGDHPYKLPSSFFSCQELTRLCLCNCEFSLPASFRGFNRLISLHFTSVTFATDLFGNFISSCPQLEELVLMNSSRLDCSEISAPNLKYPLLRGICNSFCFKNVPLLQSALINTAKESSDDDEDVSSDEKGSDFHEFFGCLPALEKLTANNRFFLVIFPNFAVVDEISILLFLRRVDCSNIVLDELREVQIANFSGLEPELVFIKLLLAKSPMLETMLINTSGSNDVGKYEWLKRLTRFRRASPMAEILYE